MNHIGPRSGVWTHFHCHKCWQWGYLLNQVLLTKVLIMLKDLSRYASLVLSCDFALILLWEVGETSTTGSSTILNQLEAGLEAGSIIVMHMKSISIPSFLPRSMYGLIKTRRTASQGVIVISLFGSFPYFCESLLFTWQDQQFLTCEHTVECICFQYIAALCVSSRHVFPGCCR